MLVKLHDMLYFPFLINIVTDLLFCMIPNRVQVLVFYFWLYCSNSLFYKQVQNNAMLEALHLSEINV